MTFSAAGTSQRGLRATDDRVDYPPPTTAGVSRRRDFRFVAHHHDRLLLVGGLWGHLFAAGDLIMLPVLIFGLLPP